jgi:hypothetical protein
MQVVTQKYYVLIGIDNLELTNEDALVENLDCQIPGRHL